MRMPATVMSGHLMWTSSGVTWATWRLQGLAKGFGGSETSAWSRADHQALFQGILGESVLLGLTADLDPTAIVNKMLAGVDVNESRGWAEECLLTLDQLADRPLGKREYWLAVPLKGGNWKNRAYSAYTGAETALRDALALPLRRPSAREMYAALQAAGKIEEAIPVNFNPHRASVAEQAWIAAHNQTRGLGLDSAAPDVSGGELGGVGRRYPEVLARNFSGGSILPNPVIDEGAQSDSKSRLTRFNPVSRRFVKIQSTREDHPSYQVLMALAGSPKGGWEEGADWLGRLDQLGVDADWVLRLNTIKAKDALKRNRRAEANLNDQMDQQDGTAAITGSGGALDDVADALQKYHIELNRTEKEVEVQASIIVAVGDRDAAEAQRKARFVKNDFKGIDFTFEIPLGAQEALWWAMQPGVPTDRAVREFTEITTGRDFASLVPITSTELGDSQGILWGENQSSGKNSPIMLDLWGQIEGDVSAAIGLAAEPGAGKTTAVKSVLGDTHDRGGRFVAIDRTQLREYGIFAKSLDPKHTCIADLTEPEYSLDPLRVFGPQAGASLMQSLLSALLSVPARSPGGVMLSELLEPSYAVENNLDSAGALLAHVRKLGEADPEAKSLAGLMGLYANKPYGRVLFDRDLPSLDLNSRGIVFLTHGVALPEEHELMNSDLFREMSLDKLFGRAMYALLISMAREICFSRPKELTLFAVDEVFHVTASIEGRQELLTFIRDGRKHGAPCLIASQDARDFGDEVTRGLIKNRVLMRQTDEELAKKNLEWFSKGMENDDEMIRIVTKDLSPLGANNKVPEERRGEGLLRDARGRMGKFRKTVSLRPDRRAAVMSTPSKTAAAEQSEAAS